MTDYTEHGAVPIDDAVSSDPPTVDEALADRDARRRPPVDDLRAEVVVQAPQESAFSLFTLQFGSWWPPEFSWSGAAKLEGIGMEPRADGFLHEYGPYGLRLDWGRILVWEPPERLVFSWQIGPDRVPVPDPTQATEVEVRFTPTNAGSTHVEVTHSCWDRHGDQAERYREDFSQAWPYALQRLATEANAAI